MVMVKTIHRVPHPFLLAMASNLVAMAFNLASPKNHGCFKCLPGRHRHASGASRRLGQLAAAGGVAPGDQGSVLGELLCSIY